MKTVGSVVAHLLLLVCLLCACSSTDVETIGDTGGRGWQDVPATTEVRQVADTLVDLPADVSVDVPGVELQAEAIAGETMGETPCTPDCDGKECGTDGCGGYCGMCLGAQDDCVDGVCFCVPGCDGKECGDDGCGGNCGGCGEGESCDANVCVCAAPCGEKCCEVGEVCIGVVCCEPNCSNKVCGEDGCGGTCGECGDSQVCNLGACCTPDCDGKACGFDGCGGNCGVCPSPGLCWDDACCYPDCEGKACGDDGCGGTCGLCGDIELCVEGQCAFDPIYVGCSDGTREGFLNVADYQLIAACGGAWDVPGIHNEEPGCDRQSGNTGVNPQGTGCTVTDLCSKGWHVCLGKDDVLYRSPLGCVDIMKGAESPAFFLVRTSSTGAFNCAPDTIGDPTSINDIFGCGDLGCPANEASCEPLQLGSHDHCKSLKLMGGCTCSFKGELPAGDPNYVDGDFENVVCSPMSGGCGWCKTLNYFNKLLGANHQNAWDCGTNGTQEAINVIKTEPYTQGGVLCCMDQCYVDSDCGDGQVCIMSTCQDQ